MRSRREAAPVPVMDARLLALDALELDDARPLVAVALQQRAELRGRRGRGLDTGGEQLLLHRFVLERPADRLPDALDLRGGRGPGREDRVPVVRIDAGDPHFLQR